MAARASSAWPCAACGAPRRGASAASAGRATADRASRSRTITSWPACADCIAHSSPATLPPRTMILLMPQMVSLGLRRGKAGAWLVPIRWRRRSRPGAATRPRCTNIQPSRSCTNFVRHRPFSRFAPPRWSCSPRTAHFRRPSVPAECYAERTVAGWAASQKRARSRRGPALQASVGEERKRWTDPT